MRDTLIIAITVPTSLREFRGNFDLDWLRAITFLTIDHKKPTCPGHIGRALTRFGAN